MDVLARARALEAAGRDIVHFEIGEPDFPTPAKVKEAGQRAIAEDASSYTPARGEPALIEAIVGSYAQQYGVKVDPARVVVSAGTSPVLLMALMAMVDPGDEVIVPRPYYPCYPNFVRLAGATPVFVDTRAEDGFRLRPEAVEAAITAKTKALLFGSPSNPTGAVAGAETLRGLAALGIPLIADEIYHGLVYDGAQHSALEFAGEAFVINGFSKAYSMTGWRLGYAVVPVDLVREVEVLQQNIVISANSFSQRAGITALTHPEVRQDIAHMKTAFAERREAMVSGLRALGLEVPVMPAGAFYVLADARKFSGDSMALAGRCLEEAGVAVTPGDDFGAPGFLRFSYTTSLPKIREGLDRLSKVFR
jgi:aspartate aminotransferase